MPHKLGDALEKLAECVKTVMVTEVVERREKAGESNQFSGSASARGEISAKSTSMAVGVAASAATSDASENEVITKGFPKLTVNMGEANRALKDVADASGHRIWILLDEWSSLPETLQPFLADFIRRAILPVQAISVQIAAIEYRSAFRVDFEGYRVGMELGSDISADINLDDYFVYDVNATASVDFFKNLLYKHLRAFAGKRSLLETSADDVLNSVFSQDRVFNELVRAAEGVPRDFINILQLAAMRADQGKISMNAIRSAAKDWFDRDKQRNLDTNPRVRALLDWIRDSVIEGRKARAFLLKIDTTDEAIEYLFDERMLHIAKRSYSAKDEPGVRYRVWKVDFGCYVDLIKTANDPVNFLGSDVSFSAAGDIEVPEDDYRAVRRAILNLNDFEASRQN